MLQQKAVSPTTFSLLKKLMDVDEFDCFNLAGGTALALQIGHRVSYDLDFFGITELSTDDISLVIQEQFGVKEIHKTKNIIVFDIQGIKVDFVKYPYSLIKEPVREQGVRMLHIEDISAMKLDAVKGRGKKRDFYDLYALLQKYRLTDLLLLHKKKYNQDASFQILKGLVYFDDAENDPPVNQLIAFPDWEKIKQEISNIVYEL